MRLAILVTVSLTACSCALYSVTKRSSAPATGDPAQPPVSTTVSVGGPDGAGHDPAPGDDSTVTLPNGRQYLVGNLPGDATAHPLLVVLHGLYMSARTTERVTDWTNFATSHNWAVVYGIGQHGSWNAGTCCGYAAAQDTDDVGYLRSVLADVQKYSTIDPLGIYLAGFSNGGMLAADAACELPNVFAAVVTVAGPLLAPSQGCSPTLALHGTADTTIPLDGGFSKVTKTYVPSDRFIASTQQTNGNRYDLTLLAGAGHAWPQQLDGRPATTAISDWLIQAGLAARRVVVPAN